MLTTGASSLSNLETKIISLERANFDLKMQLHYLNQKKTDNNSNIDQYQSRKTSNVRGILEYNNVLEENHNEIIDLREEKTELKRRIGELESEVLQLRLLRDNDTLDYRKKSKLDPSNTALIDENRKKEREVAKAIAEHDAAIIQKLQEDLKDVNRVIEREQKIAQDSSTKLAHHMEILAKRETEMAQLSKLNYDLQSNINQLMLTTQRQEAQLNELLSHNAQLMFDVNKHLPLTSSDVRTLQDRNPQFTYQGRDLSFDRKSIYSPTKSSSLLFNSNQHPQNDNEFNLAFKMESELYRSIQENKGLKESIVEIERDRDVAKNQLRILQEKLESLDLFNKSQISQFNENGLNTSTSSIPGEKNVSMYREREKELIFALEGVVKRCQELENQLNLHGISII